MTSDEIRQWKNVALYGHTAEPQPWETSKPYSDYVGKEAKIMLASLETAYQLAKLNEYIEAGATITIRPPKDGRKFRLDT